MPTLVCLSLLVAMATAAPGDRCCLNTTFSFVLRVTYFAATNTTMPIVQTQTQWFDYDYDMMMQRIIVNGTSVLPPVFSFSRTVYNDFRHSKSYRIDNGSCTVEHLAAPRTPHCIPDSFTKGGDFTIGSGSRIKRLTVWSGVVDGVSISYNVDEDCTPVAMSTMGTSNGAPYMVDALITDVNNGFLHSPDALGIPPICKHGPDAVGK